MVGTVLYDPLIHANPLASGFFAYGQLPTAPIFLQNFPPSSVGDITDVYEVLPLPQVSSSTGTRLNTNGTLINISPGYEPLTYYASNGTIKIPTGRTLTLTPFQGYAGFANHTIDLDFANLDLFTFDPNSAELTPVNGAFPVLDPGQGFAVEFDLAIALEQSNANRAGFSVTVISNDLSKGLEIGFKEAGLNSDYIFAQNANLNAASEGERSVLPLEIQVAQRYRLAMQGSSYTLSVNGTTLLTGTLRDYSFDPTLSSPPFPEAVNPYETPNFLFFGDNTDQGYADFTLGRVALVSLPPSLARRSDFSGNGSADILWRNQAGGQTLLWQMEGTTLKDGAFFGPPVPAEWAIKAVGDLNGDGRPDIVWQHQQTSAVAAWQMDGTTLTTGDLLPPVDPLWQLTAASDFNQDGKDDLLWRHQTTGNLVVWYMDGLTQTGGDLLTAPAVADAAWEIGAVGDFSNDGNPDILWHNRTTGAIGFWSMTGITFNGVTSVTQGGSPLTTVDPAWQAIGTADFNQDGQLDVLWRHRQNGGTVLWLMDNFSIISGVGLPTVDPAGWTASV